MGKAKKAGIIIIALIRIFMGLNSQILKPYIWLSCGYHNLFYNYWPKRLPLLFAIVVISLIIAITPTITSVLALSPSPWSTSHLNSSPQKQPDNSKSTFKYLTS